MYCSKLRTLATDQVFETDSLQAFVSECPNLQEIGLDIGYWEDEYIDSVMKSASELTENLKAIKPALAVHRISSWGYYAQYDVMNM